MGSGRQVADLPIRAPHDEADPLAFAVALKSKSSQELSMLTRFAVAITLACSLATSLAAQVETITVDGQRFLSLTVVCSACGAGRGGVTEVAGEEAATGEDAVLADVAVVSAQPTKVSSDALCRRVESWVVRTAACSAYIPAFREPQPACNRRVPRRMICRPVASEIT